MKPEEFAKELAKKQAVLKKYINTIFPKKAGNIALRFINGNFRAQGWQGSNFQPWKKTIRKGTILVKSGKGRRGTSFTTTPGEAHIKNDVNYMAAHNNGFNGIVNIKAHTRKNFEAKKVAAGGFTKTGKAKMKTIHTVKSISTVKAHTRKMNIPKRQFMPQNINDSPVLAKAVRREIERELKNIF